jgi:hypothetical protein
VMAPPPISIFGSQLEQRGKAAIISRLVLHNNSLLNVYNK